jgi:hypothetical protein
MNMKRLILMSAAGGCLLTVQMQPANALGCFSGAALGAVAGHMVHHTFLGMFGGCAGGMVVHRMYSHWKKTHPNGTMSEFVEDNKDHLPDGWADKLGKLGDSHVKPGVTTTGTAQ